MPLFYQHTVNEDTRLGIWKIEEPESFFLLKVPLQRQISHPHKRLQHLAGRWLLQLLFPDFPYELIRIADTRKPFLSNEAYHFSISHCGDFAAAIVSRSNRVGVDIEEVKPMIERISHKFLSPEEMALLDYPEVFESIPRRLPLPLTESTTDRHLRQLTLAWSAKEAIYKWHGIGGLDFKKHIQLRGKPTGSALQGFTASYLLCLQPPVPMTIVSGVMDDLILSYISTA